MYPFHYPSSSYAPAYASSDSDYYHALAEERAAREQFVAAQRAQEEARQRAARARAARRAYAAPYSSFHDDEYSPLDLDMDLDGGAYYPQQRPLSAPYQPYGFASPSPFSAGPYGMNPRQQRALVEEQRRREMLEEQQRREVLELERERRRQEEERLRRVLLEERQREEAERRRMLEEERARRVLEEEKLRRAIEEEKLRRAMLEEEAARRERERTPLRSQQDSLQSLLRALGFVPAGMDSDSEQERQTRDARNGRSMRAHTTSPNPRRASAAPRSPIRPTKSDQPSTSPTSSFADTLHAKPPSPTPAPVTTIPIWSPKPTPAEVPAAEKQKQESALPPLANPTPEQVSAAAKIQEAYRAHSARTHALKSISTLRTRFLAAKAAFTLPPTLDYEGPSRTHVTVTLPTPSALSSPPLSTTGEEEEDPFAHVPKLAYTPNNAPLHAYEEELSRILSALDAVESRGDAGVRAARRELARMVEREAERVERWRGVVWDWWTGREKAQEQPSVAETEVPSAPTEAVEVTPSEPASEEPAMQVEASSEPAPVDAAPTAAATDVTPEPAPMAVEPAPTIATPHIPISREDHETTLIPADTPTSDPQPSPAATPEQPPTPEIDIPDASLEPEEAAPTVDIDIEPPSRAEPASLDDVEEAEEASTVPEPDRSSSPSLSDDLESADAEMEVEPQEAHTPPPGVHTPLVVVDAPALHDAVENVPVGGALKRGASPLVDRSWDEFRAYDLF